MGVFCREYRDPHEGFALPRHTRRLRGACSGNVSFCGWCWRIRLGLLLKESQPVDAHGWEWLRARLSELDANEVEKAKHIPAGAPYRHIPRAVVGTKPTHTDERCCAVNSYFNLTASPGIMSLTAPQMAHFRQSIPGYVIHSPCILHVDIYTHYPHRSAHIKFKLKKKQNPRCMICMCQRERLPCTSFRSAPWEVLADSAAG